MILTWQMIQCGAGYRHKCNDSILIQFDLIQYRLFFTNAVITFNYAESQLVAYYYNI